MARLGAFPIENRPTRIYIYPRAYARGYGLLPQRGGSMYYVYFLRRIPPKNSDFSTLERHHLQKPVF